MTNFLSKICEPFSRFALFVIYFWFGALKVAGESPASGVVQDLFEKTMPIMSFDLFLILFGLFECLLGILFLIPKATRAALFLFFIHMITTFMPLFLLPNGMWTGFLTPTLEGQYIIKNLALIAIALGLIRNPQNNPQREMQSY
jgi:uncharacterized membrane protein YkgB